MIGKVLFFAGTGALLWAVAETAGSHAVHAPAASSDTGSGGVGWLALPAAVLVIVCVIGGALAYRRERSQPAPTRPSRTRAHDHWHVIINAQPVGGGPWVVVGRGYREQMAASRAEVAAAVVAEAEAINAALRYRAQVVEARPVATRGSR